MTDANSTEANDPLEPDTGDNEAIYAGRSNDSATPFRWSAGPSSIGCASIAQARSVLIWRRIPTLSPLALRDAASGSVSGALTIALTPSIPHADEIRGAPAASSITAVGLPLRSAWDDESTAHLASNPRVDRLGGIPRRAGRRRIQPVVRGSLTPRESRRTSRRSRSQRRHRRTGARGARRDSRRRADHVVSCRDRQDRVADDDERSPRQHVLRVRLDRRMRCGSVVEA